MELIDKSTVVAEIEKLEKMYCYDNKTNSGLVAISIFKSINNVIDTLEMKEVDLETNIQDYIDSHFTERCDGSMISDWYKVLSGIHYNDLKEIAKHFFELGLITQKGE